jgi:DNA transformation protein
MPRGWGSAEGGINSKKCRDLPAGYSILPVSEEYITYILDQLQCVGPVVSKRMFGGAGLYLEGVFFALIANDVLYFKVDDSNRKDYEAMGMGPFRPYRDKPTTMQYYEVPADVLEDEETLRLWADRAFEAARRKRKKRF